MRKLSAILLGSVILGSIAFAADTKDPPVGYDDTPFLPDGWRVHDIDRPQPTVVTPGKKCGDAPSDAIVLFDGTNLDAWKGQVLNDKKRKKFNLKGEALWKVENGYVECTRTGDLFTRQEFGSCQLHIEWATENPPNGKSQGRGNSGVFLMGKYEIQVLDCVDNRTYADGGAGSVYGQKPPMVNASRNPGEWQAYDIIFEAPKFKGDKMVKPPYITVLHNGIVVQHRTEILGPTSHKKLPVVKAHPEKLSIKLQDHNNKTRFRNIWIRELEF